MRRILTWPLERLAVYLIPGWIDDGSPDGWRFRLICWAWREEERRRCPEAFEDAVDRGDEVPF